MKCNGKQACLNQHPVTHSMTPIVTQSSGVIIVSYNHNRTATARRKAHCSATNVLHLECPQLTVRKQKSEQVCSVL